MKLRLTHRARPGAAQPRACDVAPLQHDQRGDEFIGEDRAPRAAYASVASTRSVSAPPVAVP